MSPSSHCVPFPYQSFSLLGKQPGFLCCCRSAFSFLDKLCRSKSKSIKVFANPAEQIQLLK